MASPTHGTSEIPVFPFKPTRNTPGVTETAYLTTGPGPTLKITSRFIRPSAQRAFGINMAWISAAVVAACAIALILLAATSTSTAPSSTSSSTGGWQLLVVALGLVVLTWSAVIGLLVLRHRAQPMTVEVPAHDVRRVKVSPNYNNLWWVLLIGVFAIIPVLAGRKVLRLELPPGSVGGDERPRLLRLRELHHGDAELIAKELQAPRAELTADALPPPPPTRGDDDRPDRHPEPAGRT